MIKNEKQYKITKAQTNKLNTALRLLQNNGDKDLNDNILKDAEKEALCSQISDLKIEINEYEKLRSGELFMSEISSLAELPHTLIKARIALGLTHKELGKLLGLKEQQIQRYEANDYKTASLSRILEIIKVLGIKHKIDVSVISSNTSIKSILKKLKNIGIDYKFIIKRLIPFSLFSQIEKDLDKNTSEPNGSIIQTASIISKVFNWKVSDLIGQEPLKLDMSITGCPNFKKRKKSEERRFNAYVVYAHYLALLLLEATSGLPNKDIPTDPHQVRNDIIDKYGTLSFENAVCYIWEMGIPVLPLNDPGAFHGACWRVDGRNIIVLKQKTRSQARWLFDLFHELWHIAQNPNERQLSIIEPGINDIEYFASDEEIEASQFAGDVILSGRAEEITELCVKKAKGSVELLKSAVIHVSKKEKVPVDSLSYYIAFRLSLQEIDWWGAAENLQIIDTEPLAIARNFLLKQRLFDKLNEVDRNLLMQALLA